MLFYTCSCWVKGCCSKLVDGIHVCTTFNKGHDNVVKCEEVTESNKTTLVLALWKVSQDHKQFIYRVAMTENDRGLKLQAGLMVTQIQRNNNESKMTTKIWVNFRQPWLVCDYINIAIIAVPKQWYSATWNRLYITLVLPSVKFVIAKYLHIHTCTLYSLKKSCVW